MNERKKLTFLQKIGDFALSKMKIDENINERKKKFQIEFNLIEKKKDSSQKKNEIKEIEVIKKK